MVLLLFSIILFKASSFELLNTSFGIFIELPLGGYTSLFLSNPAFLELFILKIHINTSSKFSICKKTNNISQISYKSISCLKIINNKLKIFKEKS